MSDKIPVLSKLRPLARCGGCGLDLYAHSTCRSQNDACPLRGAQWAQMLQARAMQNAASPLRSSIEVLTHGYDEDDPEAA